MLMNAACHSPEPGGHKKVSEVSGTNTPAGPIIIPSEADEPELPAVFLVVDTGYNYYDLREKMLAVAQKSGWPIDTIDRTFIRDSILPADPSPAFFDGGYFPRMHFREFLSIDYWDDCAVEGDGSPDNKMVVIAGIYKHRLQADSALLRLRKFYPAAFIQEGMLMNHEIH